MYVVKRIIKEEQDADGLQWMKNEVEALRDLPHCPHIVHMKHTFDNEEIQHLVLEYMKGGTLLDLLVQQQAYTEQDSRQVLKNILEAVAYMHSRGMAHRDLRPENLLLPVRFQFLCNNL